MDRMPKCCNLSILRFPKVFQITLLEGASLKQQQQKCMALIRVPFGEQQCMAIY